MVGIWTPLQGAGGLPFPEVLHWVVAQEETPWLLSCLLLGFQVTLRTAGRSEERLFPSTSLPRDQCVLMMRMNSPL